MNSILDRYLNADTPQKTSKTRAIRLKCLDCCANQQAEVRQCPAVTCPLWPYRMGPKYINPPESLWKKHLNQ